MDKLYKICLRSALLLGLAALVIYAADKPPAATVERVMQSMLMFDMATRSVIPSGITASGDTASATYQTAMLAREKAEAATYFSAMTTNLTSLTAIARTNAAVWNIDFGQSYQTREPAAVNQMAQEQWCTPTNIAGTLYEDHYLEFSATPSDAPGTVFNYRDQLGTEYNVEATTNSYPDLFPVVLPSGVHSCYWFRCAVPVAFTNRLRRWNGAARFGGPEGSAYGLDIAGAFLVDDGNDIWQGRTFTADIGTNTVEWVKGFVVTPLSLMALSTESESTERSILDTLAIPYRSARSFFQPPKVNLTSNTLTKTTWQGSEQYKLAFPIKRNITK